jgi:hypothetical protein
MVTVDADDDEPVTDVDLKIDASALEDEGLEETKLRPASDPLLPKSAPTLTMDLPPTVPIPFPALAALRAEAGPAAPPQPIHTIAPVIAEVPPPARRPQAVTVLVRPRRRGMRWGRAVLLALLAMLLLAGFVKRAAVRETAIRSCAWRPSG